MKKEEKKRGGSHGRTFNRNRSILTLVRTHSHSFKKRVKREGSHGWTFNGNRIILLLVRTPLSSLSKTSYKRWDHMTERSMARILFWQWSEPHSHPSENERKPVRKKWLNKEVIKWLFLLVKKKCGANVMLYIVLCRHKGCSPYWKSIIFI